MELTTLPLGQLECLDNLNAEFELWLILPKGLSSDDDK